MNDEDDEIARCRQCDWPIRRGEPITWAYALCLGCGKIHETSAIHLEVCALAMAMGEDRATTQRRRAGVMGMN